MFAVVNIANRYLGYITLDDIRSHPKATEAEDVLQAVGRRIRDVYVHETDPLEAAKRKLRQKKLPFIPVIDFERHYVGTIDRDST